MRQLFRELKRRHVFRVAAVYAVVAWLVIQVANVVLPRLQLPGWTVTFVIVLVALGFPIALVVAWAFEMTPEGVQRTSAEGGGTEETDRTSVSPEERRSESRLAMQALVGLGLVGAAVAGGWYLMGGGGGTEPAPRLGDRSIAVLPFDNLSGTEEAEPFVNGLHDDLLTRLSNVSELKVISRTSVLPYRETELSLPAIADSLGVRWIVEGGVQQAGGRVQVNAQLIQAEEDVHRLAETYRRELTTENLFEVQGELTKKIARSLEAELGPGEARRVERRPTGDLEAYRLYVTGRGHLDQRTGEGTRRAVGYFRRALERDSSYALAWVGWADAILLRDSYGYPPLADSLAVDPEPALRRALAIDSTLAEAHASMGLVEKGVAAVRALQRAVELKPSYARAHHWLGLRLAGLGRLDQGLAHLERAAELDPLSPPIHGALALGHYWSGRPEEALREVRRAEELSPDVSLTGLLEGVLLSAVGRQEEALAALDRGLERTTEAFPDRGTYRGWRAVIHARAGDTARAREALAALGGASGHAFGRGVALTALGEVEEALAAFREASITDPAHRAAWFRYAPVLEPIRGLDGYRELIRDVNRQWGLHPDGSLPDSVDVSFGSRSGE